MSNGTALDYDPLGRLWRVTKNGTSTRFEYDGDRLVTELDGAGAVLRRYAHGDGADEPLVAFEGPGMAQAAARALHADERGSIVLVTTAMGSNATTVAINTYDEYGIPGSGNAGRFQYTGQAWLAELGLYYYKARMYLPTLGRFLQTDPIGYADGLNWYAYVGGDPVNARDPSGLCSMQVETHGDGWASVDWVKLYDGPCNMGGGGGGGGFLGFIGSAFRGLTDGILGGSGGSDGRAAPKASPAPVSPPALPQNNQKNTCDALQRGGQALGKFAIDIGGGLSDLGLGVGGTGLLVAGGSAATLNPAGVLAGGALVVDGGTMTGVGGLITAGGASLMALSGSGKEAAKDLGARVLTRRIPSGPLKDWANKGIGMVMSLLPEIKSCR